MANALANEGLRLVNAGKYEEGIQKLTQALEDRPAPMWMIERSKAYLRTKQLDLALQDAEKALSVALQRANRDLMIESQIRRAVTLFRMGRYADADVCAFWAIQLLRGAKASEDDGQQNKVNENGEYTATYKEVSDDNARLMDDSKKAGLAAAMGGGRTKDSSNSNQAFTWRIQALSAMEKLPTGDPGRKVSVVKYPKPAESAAPVKAQKEQVVEIDGTDEEMESETQTPSNAATSPWEKIWNGLQLIHTKNQVKVDFYQTGTTLNVSVFVKDVPKETLKVDAQEQIVILSPITSVPSHAIILHLFDEIKPAETSYTVKSMKIELVLKKANPGKWRVLQSSFMTDALTSAGTLEEQMKKIGYDDPSKVMAKFGDDTAAMYRDVVEKLRGRGAENGPSDTSVNQAALQSAAMVTPVTAAKPSAPAPKPAAPSTAKAPAYPTSSKSGPKDWDNIDVDDDAGPDGKDVDDFFKQIYKDADPDSKRAMMKSYVESNGTALSTSWAETKDKKYAVDPPDSVEVKSWD